MVVFLRGNKHLWPDLPTVQERYFEAYGDKVEDHVDDMQEMSSDSDQLNLSRRLAPLIIVLNTFGISGSLCYYSLL